MWRQILIFHVSSAWGWDCLKVCGSNYLLNWPSACWNSDSHLVRHYFRNWSFCYLCFFSIFSSFPSVLPPCLGQQFCPISHSCSSPFTQAILAATSSVQVKSDAAGSAVPSGFRFLSWASMGSLCLDACLQNPHYTLCICLLKVKGS